MDEVLTQDVEEEITNVMVDFQLFVFKNPSLCFVFKNV